METSFLFFSLAILNNQMVLESSSFYLGLFWDLFTLFYYSYSKSAVKSVVSAVPMRFRERVP